MSNLKIYQTLSSRIVHKNNWFRVRRDETVKPNGKRGEYFFVETFPSVFVVAVDASQKIYLIKQYRYPNKKFSWEVPAGSSDGQKPLLAAKRELWEETGFKAKKWRILGKINPMNGLASEEMYVFLAAGLKQTQKNKQDEEGIIEEEKFSMDQILKMFYRGQISCGQTISAVMLYLASCLAMTHNGSHC